MTQLRNLGGRIRRRLKRLIYAPIDTYDLLRGARPPDDKMFVGDGSWRAVGNEFLSYFRRFGGLLPDHHVLDAGCGIGRMAAPLTRYLSPRGRYEGFDVVADGIEWCTKAISPRFPNFRFTRVPVYNKHYNPLGTVAASEFVFPYEDGSFDLVFLTSVFTHMLPDDLRNYIRQVSRVLRPGGRCLVTFFLMNERAKTGIAHAQAAFAFVRQVEGHYVADPIDPEAAVAYDESDVRAALRTAGLDVQSPVRYGSWSGAKPYVSFQDILVAVKL